jgi:hypothetical protein
MRPAGALLLTAVLAAPAAAEVTVRVVPGAPGSTPSVELTARQAPLAEVLDRLSRQIGMKVVYEGASPRQLVTLSLQGRTPAETVLALFEGTGVNFALQSDPTGARVETLLVAGSAPQTASSSPASSSSGTGRSLSPSTFRRPAAPPGSGPDAMEEDPEDVEEEEIEEQPEAPEQPERPERPPGQPADPAGAVQPVGPQVPPQGYAPTSSFPVSPFAPQATQPYAPQTFPPMPPGVSSAQPTQPSGQQQQPQQQQPETSTGQPPPD